MVSNTDENVSALKSSSRAFQRNLNELKQTSYEKVMALWSFGQTGKNDGRVDMWHHQGLTHGSTKIDVGVDVEMHTWQVACWLDSVNVDVVFRCGRADMAELLTWQMIWQDDYAAAMWTNQDLPRGSLKMAMEIGSYGWKKICSQVWTPDLVRTKPTIYC